LPGRLAPAHLARDLEISGHAVFYRPRRRLLLFIAVGAGTEMTTAMDAE
jgi:hypothetical protein